MNAPRVKKTVKPCSKGRKMNFIFAIPQMKQATSTGKQEKRSSHFPASHAAPINFKEEARGLNQQL